MNIIDPCVLKLRETLREYKRTNPSSAIHINHICSKECFWIRENDFFACLTSGYEHECGISKCQMKYFHDNSYQCLKTGFIISTTQGEDSNVNKNYASTMISDTFGMFVNSKLSKIELDRSISERTPYTVDHNDNNDNRSRRKTIKTKSKSNPTDDSNSRSISADAAHKRQLNSILNLNYLDINIEDDIMKIFSPTISSIQDNEDDITVGNFNNLLSDNVMDMTEDVKIEDVIHPSNHNKKLKTKILYNDSNNDNSLYDNVRKRHPFLTINTNINNNNNNNNINNNNNSTIECGSASSILDPLFDNFNIKSAGNSNINKRSR
jgi:hypothetical protein